MLTKEKSRVKPRRQIKTDEWIELDSRAVQRLRYDSRQNRLRVVFINNEGSKYYYEDTTLTEFCKLMASDSIGTYFNQIFKPQHPKYRKIQN